MTYLFDFIMTQNSIYKDSHLKTPKSLVSLGDEKCRVAALPLAFDVVLDSFLTDISD